MAKDVRRMRTVRIDASSIRILSLRFLLTSFCLSCGSPSTTLQVPGTIEIRDVHVSSLAAGRLARLLKDEGDSVRRGDTIAVLEQPGLTALIGQRRAQADAARHRTAEVAAAVADSVRAANDVARAIPLRERGIVSP